MHRRRAEPGTNVPEVEATVGLDGGHCSAPSTDHSAGRTYGPRSTNFCGGVLDWSAFQHQRMRDSVDRTRQMWLMVGSCIFFAVLVRLISSYGAAGDILPPCTGLAVAIAAHILCRLCRTIMERCETGGPHEWHLCLAYQLICVCGLNLLTLFMSLARGGDQSAHRVFLVGYLGSLFFAIEIFYMPQGWHIGVVCFPALCMWMFFYICTDTFSPVMAAWGIGLPVLEFWAFRLVEQREWSLYQMIRHEKRARALSEALEEALRGMLSSVFDASCECDDRGTVLSSSPHLLQLLGTTGAGLAGLNFAALAAKPSESKRIAAFLAQCAGAARGPAAKIETSLCREDDGVSSELRLTLCCVTLPADGTGLVGQRLLIGFQRAQADDVVREPSSSNPVFPDSPEDADENSGGGSGRGGSGAGQPFSLPPDVDSLSDKPAPDADCDGRSLTELSFTLTQPSVAFSGRGSSRALSSSSRAGKRETRSAGTQTDMEPAKQTDIEPAKQTEAEPQESSCHTSPDSASTQTSPDSAPEAAAAQQPVAAETRKWRPPKLPERPPSACTVDAAPQGAASMRPPPSAPMRRSGQAGRKHRHVGVSGVRCMMPNYAQTKTRTVWFLLEELMEKVFPRGKGCCHWHVGTKMLAQVIGLMAARKCSRTFTPRQGWQCSICGGLNDPEEDDEGDCRECDVCGEVDAGRDTADCDAANACNGGDSSEMADHSVEASASSSEGSWQ